MVSIKFYKETNLKEDPAIGNIPKEWKVARLKDVADYLNGYPFSPKDWKDRGLPIIRIQNLNDPSAEFNYFQGDIEDRYIVENGDLLFSWSASIGAYIWDRGKAVLNQHIFKVVPNDDVDKLYLYYALFLAIEQLKQKVHGSTMKHFKKTELETKIPLPSLSEQKAIAGVLCVVDSAIELVDKIIAKTERLKKGLMQELLTRGIGHKEFKEDPEIGRIPKGWNVLALEDFCEVTDGSHWSPKEVERSNYKIATVANLRETYIDIDSCKSISEEDYQHLVKEGDVPRKNDILFSKDGTVGICFVFKQQENNIGLLSSIAIITPNYKVLNSEFGAYALKSPNVFWQIVGRKTGTALRRITLENLRKVKIPIPSMSEQQKIAETLSSVDNILRLKKEKKGKLIKMKKRLMDLLLTGKVRVSV